MITVYCNYCDSPAERCDAGGYLICDECTCPSCEDGPAVCNCEPCVECAAPTPCPPLCPECTVEAINREAEFERLETQIDYDFGYYNPPSPH